MPAWRGGITAASIIVLATLLLVVCYLAMCGTPPLLAVILAATQIAAIAWLFTGNWNIHRRTGLVSGLLVTCFAAAFLCGLPPRSVGLAVSGGCHAAAYIGLLRWFATSLRPNGDPMVTRFARRMRRTMPANVVLYTRHVTIAWCVFFAAQLAASLGLLLAAPLAVWAAFVNVLNLPLVMAMVLAEFACRLVRFRNEPHTGLIDTILGLRRAYLLPASRP